MLSVGTGLIALHVLTDRILISKLKEKLYHYLYFNNEKNEAQWYKRTRPRSNSGKGNSGFIVLACIHFVMLPLQRRSIQTATCECLQWARHYVDDLCELSTFCQWGISSYQGEVFQGHSYSTTTGIWMHVCLNSNGYNGPESGRGVQNLLPKCQIQPTTVFCK